MDYDLLKCQRCLVYEMADADRYKNLYEYIKNLDDELKVTDERYQERLAQCKKCDFLLAGVCRICGCYVEMRAAIKQRSCPHEDRKW